MMKTVTQYLHIEVDSFNLDYHINEERVNKNQRQFTKWVFIAAHAATVHAATHGSLKSKAL